MDKLLSLKKTSEILGVVPHTLREWDANGKLKSVRTEGGHRRYRESDIRSLVGDTEKPLVSNT